MKGLNIRLGSVEDLPALLPLELAAQPYPWPERVFVDLLKSNRVVCTVVENKEIEDYQQKIVAFALVQSAADEASLLNIVVAPEQQGKGIGRILLNHLIDELMERKDISSFFLEVRVTNFSAIALYLSCGFVEVGERRDYYITKSGGREDALMMALPLIFE